MHFDCGSPAFKTLVPLVFHPHASCCEHKEGNLLAMTPIALRLELRPWPARYLHTRLPLCMRPAASHTLHLPQAAMAQLMRSLTPQQQQQISSLAPQQQKALLQRIMALQHQTQLTPQQQQQQAQLAQHQQQQQQGQQQQAGGPGFGQPIKYEPGQGGAIKFEPGQSAQLKREPGSVGSQVRGVLCMSLCGACWQAWGGRGGVWTCGRGSVLLRWGEGTGRVPVCQMMQPPLQACAGLSDTL